MASPRLRLRRWVAADAPQPLGCHHFQSRSPPPVDAVDLDRTVNRRAADRPDQPVAGRVGARRQRGGRSVSRRRRDRLGRAAPTTRPGCPRDRLLGGFQPHTERLRHRDRLGTHHRCVHRSGDRTGRDPSRQGQHRQRRHTASAWGTRSSARLKTSSRHPARSASTAVGWSPTASGSTSQSPVGPDSPRPQRTSYTS